MQSLKEIQKNTKKILAKLLGLNNKLKILTAKKAHKPQIKIFLEKKQSLILFEQKTNNFLFKIKNYKNYRNILGYPIRGQRTHTNAKTKKTLFRKNIKNK